MNCEELEEEKVFFLKNQFWGLTIAASFARVKVYNPEIIISEETKQDFKSELFVFIDTKIVPNYLHQAVDVDTHIANITKIKEWSINYSPNILNDSSFKFGVAQKLLNLYLKYCWCSGWLKEAPPHFPLDRLIQGKKIYTNWTTLNCETAYEEVLNQVYPEQNKAEWELLEYNRILKKKL